MWMAQSFHHCCMRVQAVNGRHPGDFSSLRIHWYMKVAFCLNEYECCFLSYKTILASFLKVISFMISPFSHFPEAFREFAF